VKHQPKVGKAYWVAPHAWEKAVTRRLAASSIVGERVYFRVTNGPSWCQFPGGDIRADRIGWMSLSRWQVESICGRIELAGKA
jgi:hypothetical protein